MNAGSTRLKSQVAWTFATRLLMIVNSVGAGVIVAHWLGAEGVGQLAVINVAVATAVQVCSFGLPSANTYFISQDQEQLRTAAINSLIFALLVGSLLAFGLYYVANIRPDWFGIFAARLIGVASISIPAQLITLIGLNILLAVGKIREFNLLDLVAQSFVLINAVLALIVLGGELSTLVVMNTAAALLVSVVIAVLIWIAARKLARSQWRPDGSLMARMIRYGLKFHISILAGAIIFRADLFVVNYFHGEGVAGIYSVATQFGMLLMLLPSVIATLLFPRVTAEQDQQGETTALVTRYTTFVTFFCCLAAVPFSFLLPLIYGEDFTESSRLLLILLPGVYLVGLESVLVQHFNALGLPRIIPVYWVVTLVINLVLVFSLVPQFDARGAALASTVSYALIFGFVTLQFLKSTGQSFSNVFILRRGELRQLLSLSTLVGTARGSLRG
jgi:O-antigen/teichoic acid export membrane protein